MKMLMPLRKNRLRGRHASKRVSRWQRWREYLWPSMGLGSFLRLLEIRVKRQKDAQHRVALGLAIGVFVGFLPTFGQPFVAMALAMLFAGNVVMAVVGSFVGNIWTFPLIFAWEYAVGHWILQTQNVAPFPSLTEFFHIIISLEQLKDEVWSIFLPTLLGAMVLGVIFGGITYVITRINVASYQLARQRFLENRRELRREHLKVWQKLPPRHVRKQ